MFLSQVGKFRGGQSGDDVKPHKLFRDPAYFQLSILPSQIVAFILFQDGNNLITYHVTLHHHLITSYYITSQQFEGKNNPNPSFLRRLPGRITQHFHLPLIDHNLVIWPHVFARKSGKRSLLTELTLWGSVFTRMRKWSLGGKLKSLSQL